MKIQRNEPCPCKSGKKYKKCCMAAMQDKAYKDYKENRTEIEHFTMQIIPEVEEECDLVLTRLETHNDLAGAKKTAERLYSLYPNDYMVNYLKGVCHIEENELTNAIPYFERAVQIFPYFHEARFNLGAIYLKETRIAQAVECFRKIIKLDGKNGDMAQKAQKELYLMDKMIRECSKAQSLDEYIAGKKIFNQAFESLQIKKYNEAILLFKEALLLNPEHVQSYGNMGIAYSRLGQNKLALECFDKAISIDPDYKPAIINRDLISKLNEGEKLDIGMLNVNYYKDVRDLNSI